MSDVALRVQVEKITEKLGQAVDCLDSIARSLLYFEDLFRKFEIENEVELGASVERRKE